MKSSGAFIFQRVPLVIACSSVILAISIKPMYGAEEPNFPWLLACEEGPQVGGAGGSGGGGCGLGGIGANGSSGVPPGRGGTSSGLGGGWGRSGGCFGTGGSVAPVGRP